MKFYPIFWVIAVRIIHAKLSNMKRIITAILAMTAAVGSLFAMTADEVSPENIVALLQDNGYDAEIDEDGDAAFYDEYGMMYWIILDSSEKNSLLIQSGWSATDEITSRDAFRLANEGNRQMHTIRCYYEPLQRAFYADYTMLYSEESGLDESTLLRVVEDFLEEADTYTDYLLGEGAMY